MQKKRAASASVSLAPYATSVLHRYPCSNWMYSVFIGIHVWLGSHVEGDFLDLKTTQVSMREAAKLLLRHLDKMATEAELTRPEFLWLVNEKVSDIAKLSCEKLLQMAEGRATSMQKKKRNSLASVGTRKRIPEMLEEMRLAYKFGSMDDFVGSVRRRFCNL